MDEYHIPVLLNEVLEALEIKPGEKYIDCTLGGSGHTTGILKAGGKVLGIDQDSEAIENAKRNLGDWENRGELVLRQSNFAHLKEIAIEAGFSQVSGILMDLGVSSHQLETDYRGFSFNKDAKLDMRMDPATQTVTAADLINAGGEKELANLFWKFGEERFARQIAKIIVEERKNKRFETTDQLAKAILSVRGRSDRDRTHPATRVFQALRIAVNDELASLEAALPQAVKLLKPGGKLAIISFHSLEDRIVKNFIREMGDIGVMRDMTKTPTTPTKEEIDRNPRARSGKLRVAEKI
ncbi:16S rRNA (cytosine(1402)-N(4))-methyltransferase RsmH [Patescibacteria group bacterium]|nr:16S rRNA (cytosine(1402)-N(4))-methyltransferase RsmH [Patescibacteria group bacterium]